jgi:hypothetical protein
MGAELHRQPQPDEELADPFQEIGRRAPWFAFNQNSLHFVRMSRASGYGNTTCPHVGFVAPVVAKHFAIWPLLLALDLPASPDGRSAPDWVSYWPSALPARLFATPASAREHDRPADLQ